VAGQIALAVVLTSGLAATLRSVLTLQHVDPGFDAENVVAFELNLPPVMPERVPATYSMLAEILQQLNGSVAVADASLVVNVPLEGRSLRSTVHILGTEAPSDRRRTAEQRVVMPAYFGTMRIPVLEGRDFSESDDASAPLVAIVNEAFVNRFGLSSPLESRVAFEDFSGQPVWMQVVGVAGNVHHFGLDRDAVPEVYVPLTQVPAPIAAQFMPVTPLTLVARASGPLPDAIQEVRRVVRTVAPDQPLSRVRTLRSILLASYASLRFQSGLLLLFALAAIVVATFGIYSVMSYLVVQRRREIGIRSALGAGRKDIAWLITRQGAILTLAGAAVGLVGAVALSDFARSRLVGVERIEPAALVTAAGVLAAAAFVACLAPLRDALRTDPAVVLREE